jgi:Tfp pilus assembly protein PilX
MTTLTRDTSTARRHRMSMRNDDGSLLLVIMFTIMMTALVLVATATMVSGLAKSQNSRDYAIAFQAADTAFADALYRANRGAFTPTSTSPQTGGPYTTNGVTWKWVATRDPANVRIWNVSVEAKGELLSRHFEAVIKGTQVRRAFRSLATDRVRYVVDKTEFYQHGFMGLQEFKVVSGTPDIDGYNGEYGTVGSNGVLTLGNARLDRINLWNWSTDAGRCTGTVCPVVNGGSGSADIQKFPYRAFFTATDITDVCNDPTKSRGLWRASSGTLLEAGYCYDSLLFDQSRSSFNLSQPVYVRAGGVTVNPGVNINTTLANTNAPSKGLRIATLGAFTLGTGSKIAMAVYAPNAPCTVNAGTDMQYKTLFLGAATCGSFVINGNARLRFDGGLDSIIDNTTQTSGWVYNLMDYESID